jgi:hypothetical protein
MTPVERGRLVDALEHDCRQPQHAAEMGIRNLSLVIAELAADLESASKEAKLIGEIKDEVSSLSVALGQIVKCQQDVFDAMRMGFEECGLTHRTIVASELIDRVLRANRTLAGAVQLRGVHTRLTFVSDERLVERILNNLITNALWHSGGSKISFGVRERCGDIVLEVRDNGHGIGPRTIDQILQPNDQASSLLAKGAESRSGLGLYIVRVFSERLGGTTTCISIRGQGTLFRVRLPGPVMREAEGQRHRRKVTHATAHGKFVAILDDDVAGLQVAEAAFRQFGIEVYADHDPLRWLGVVTDLTRAPDIVLLGWRPQDDHSWLQLDVVLRKWSDTSPRVIVLARQAQSEQMKSVSSVVPVLMKPVSAGKLELLVSALLGETELPGRGVI